MFKHILVPTDGSASSEIAILSAVRLAKDTGARVTGLHVIPPFHALTYRSDMLGATAEKYEADSKLNAEKHLRTVEIAAREQQVPCETLAVHAEDVYKAIIQAAYDRQCDLIAMASHGHKGMSGILLGSETNKVLTHSQTPVLVFR